MGMNSTRGLCSLESVSGGWGGGASRSCPPRFTGSPRPPSRRTMQHKCSGHPDAGSARVPESGFRAAAASVCSAESVRNRQRRLSEEIPSSELKRGALHEVSVRIFAVCQHQWTLVPGPGCPLSRPAYIITSRVHFTRVNECFSLCPEEFMRSPYLLTLHPGNGNTDQPRFRRYHDGYALKLSDLLVCLLPKVAHVHGGWGGVGLTEHLVTAQRGPLLPVNL